MCCALFSVQRGRLIITPPKISVSSLKLSIIIFITSVVGCIAVSFSSAREGPSIIIKNRCQLEVCVCALHVKPRGGWILYQQPHAYTDTYLFNEQHKSHSKTVAQVNCSVTRKQFGQKASSLFSWWRPSACKYKHIYKQPIFLIGNSL